MKQTSMTYAVGQAVDPLMRRRHRDQVLHGRVGTPFSDATQQYSALEDVVV